MRFHIIRNARIENVGKLQSCMVQARARWLEAEGWSLHYQKPLDGCLLHQERPVPFYYHREVRNPFSFNNRAVAWD